MYTIIIEEEGLFGSFVIGAVSPLAGKAEKDEKKSAKDAKGPCSSCEI